MSDEATERPILVVEDDEDIRETLQLYLQTSGYAVRTAENGQEALDVLHEGTTPCLILLDMMMPVMDGWKFLTALDGEDRLADVPVVVVTAHADQKPGDRVQDILRKPVDVRAMMETVRAHCGAPAGK